MRVKKVLDFLKELNCLKDLEAFYDLHTAEQKNSVIEIKECGKHAKNTRLTSNIRFIAIFKRLI